MILGDRSFQNVWMVYRTQTSWLLCRGEFHVQDSPVSREMPLCDNVTVALSVVRAVRRLVVKKRKKPHIV